MNTQFPSKGEIVRQWHVLDAQDLVLGRVASTAALLLMGKHKPTYTPFLDTGDHVIVINAAKVRLTGRKDEQKLYRHHTGSYPGGVIESSAKTIGATCPTWMIEDAISRYASQKQAWQADMYRVLRKFTPAISIPTRRRSQ